ncbi:MAG: tetratricopeptide repeat protein [Bryobacteraceae bacterium]|nr:tetratricopeptide repeat protein [Bryobacteraceae bacterium]MDW8377520.1 tetratricopeptide repeat protein [Bryobacterales bacterium]
MRKGNQIAGLVFVTALAIVNSSCEKLKARDHLNKGVQAYKNAKYAEAVEHFKKSVELDPTFPTARLYLATAYMSQYIPGAESPENLEFHRSAKENFLKVLEQNPSDKIAVASLASLHYSQAQAIPKLEDKLAKLDEARVWYQKLAEVDPENKEAYYSLGVIVWAKWYPALMEARAKLGMKPSDPGPLKDKKVREELKAKYGPMIEEGIKHLEKALQIDKEYDDAMAYMNLLIRERADLAETKEEYNKDIETADNWVQKALETKKIKAARQPGNLGIVQEETK